MDKANELIVLWDNTRKGAEDSFALLHHQLYPRLFNYALKMIKDPDLAEDLLQDLFVKFWQNKCHIGAIKNVKAYFYRSVRAMMLNHIRSTQLKATKLEDMPEPELEFSKEELMVSQEHESELKGLLHAALNKLPAKQREIIYMRFYQELDYLQIAEITGIRYQSVVNHVYRAVQILRESANLSNIYAA
ncbi:sigma-70 family RNA polymerase sigma factor [Pedobacter sp. MC2016-14]|uniref:RNA polymerase sigma factor n=1 Tax=Pedobacter sp. MC2016-14 TaxID=2897327 RepID=UPI001E3BDB73|nr:sigma-70 family RNA polymerase sigma factor [Pedobacter sp. MC2016-14]MCD0487622.1 sigma-70 family RNA polymerase sigma factor [Pedobacter sp. MC2016-14]